MPSRPRSEPELTARSSTVAHHDPVHHPLHLAGGFFEDQEFVGAEEGRTGGLIQIVDYGAHAQIRVDQAWGTLPVDDNRGGADDCDQR